MLDKLRDIYYNIIYILESIKRFFYYGWKLKNSRDWDYTYLYDVMIMKIEELEKAILNDKLHVWSKRDKKDIKIAKNCLKRLRADDYFYWEGIEFEDFRHMKHGFCSRIKDRKLFLKRVDQETYLWKQDMEIFCNIFKKSSKKWWL